MSGVPGLQESLWHAKKLGFYVNRTHVTSELYNHHGSGIYDGKKPRVVGSNGRDSELEFYVLGISGHWTAHESPRNWKSMIIGFTGLRVIKYKQGHCEAGQKEYSQETGVLLMVGQTAAGIHLDSKGMRFYDGMICRIAGFHVESQGTVFLWWQE